MQDLGGKAAPRTNMRPAGAITLFVVVQLQQHTAAKTAHEIEAMCSGLLNWWRRRKPPPRCLNGKVLTIANGGAHGTLFIRRVSGWRLMVVAAGSSNLAA